MEKMLIGDPSAVARAAVIGVLAYVVLLVFLRLSFSIIAGAFAASSSSP